MSGSKREKVVVFEPLQSSPTVSAHCDSQAFTFCSCALGSFQFLNIPLQAFVYLHSVGEFLSA